MPTPPLFAPRAYMRGLVLAVSGLVCSPCLHAQQAPAAPSTTADAPALELPPFEVRTDQDTGYLAQNTASGSRLNTSLKDTASAISVFTEEFLKDIGATDISQLADYTIGTERLNGLQGDVAGGNEFAGGTADLRVRGLASTRMVNFFARNSEVDTFNTERIELARGGNALLFGPGSGGGVFNVSTKKADLHRAKNAVTYRFGTHDQSRTTLDVNVPLVKRVAAVRFNAVTDSAGSWRPHEGRESDRAALAGRWRLTPKLLLNAEYEINNIKSSKHRIWGTYDSYTDWHNAGEQLDGGAATRTARAITAVTGAAFYVWNSTDNELINYAAGGLANPQTRSANTMAPVAALGSTVAGNGPQENPMLLDFSVVPRAVTVYGDGIGNVTDLDVATASLTFEPLAHLFLEAAYNRQESDSTSFDATEFARIQWDTSPRTVTGAANPHARRPFVEMTPIQRVQKQQSDDFRFTASYEVNAGKWFGRHRLAAAYERVDQELAGFSGLRKIVVSPPATLTADNAANTLRYRTYVDLAGPVENIAVANFRFDPSGRSVWVPANNIGDTRRVTDTAMFAAQSYFWRDRLVTTFGYRKDTIDAYDSTTARTGPNYGVFAQGDLVATRNTTARTAGGITRNIGGVFHATSWLSFAANHATTFSLPNPTNRIERDSPATNTIGESDDYGLKFSLLDGKVFATITYFETSSLNDTGALNTGITQGGINAIWDSLHAPVAGEGGVSPLAARGINIDDVRSSVNSFTFDSKSQGWEFEFVANPLRGLRLSLGFSDRVTRRSNMGKELLAYLDTHRPLWNAYASRAVVGAPNTIGARLAAIDADHAIRLVLPDGKQLLGSSRQTARLRGNYAIQEGRLKGFSLGGGLRWNGPAVAGYGLAGNPLEAKRYTLVDLTAGYRTKTRVHGRALEIEFQLNASNVLDEDGLLITRLFTNNDVRTYEFQNPRDIYLTTTVRF